MASFHDSKTQCDVSFLLDFFENDIVNNLQKCGPRNSLFII